MLARPSIIGLGALAGATAVCASVLVLGPPGSLLTVLDGLQARLTAGHPAVRSSNATAPAVWPALTLFGRGVQPAVSLDGVAMSPGRKAALLSINGSPPGWIEQGDTRDGVTLVEVQRDQVTIDSEAGSATVKLGQAAPAGSASAGSANLASAPSAGPAFGPTPPSSNRIGVAPSPVGEAAARVPPYRPPPLTGPRPFPSRPYAAPGGSG